MKRVKTATEGREQFTNIYIYLSYLSGNLFMLFLFPEIVFTLSRFGNPVIEIGKYRFNKYWRSKGAKALWECTRKNTRCRARLHTVDDVITKCFNSHNHD